MRESFVLKDGQGKEFATSNHEALQLIKVSLTKLIDEKIAKTEKQLLEVA